MQLGPGEILAENIQDKEKETKLQVSIIIKLYDIRLCFLI